MVRIRVGMVSVLLFLTAFAGVGCLYASVSDCGSGDSIYPALGAGISFRFPRYRE